MALSNSGPSGDKAYIITGPTSGIGRATALELARYGTVVLVGRDLGKLNDVEQAIERGGGRAAPVICDLSDPASVRRAAARIIELGLPVGGLLTRGRRDPRPARAGSRVTRPMKRSGLGGRRWLQASRPGPWRRRSLPRRVGSGCSIRPS
jgi:NAD(P)-dependent dehydrogenase (short-subunit alcohol dehydrogenase family)